jgi:hypothetical protein
VACAASGTADVVDAIVIAIAARHQAPVVTSDPGDLSHIAESIGVKYSSSQCDQTAPPDGPGSDRPAQIVGSAPGMFLPGGQLATHRLPRYVSG